MSVSRLKEDLVFICAIIVCQVINIIAFVCGAIDNVALMLLPVLSVMAIVALRYTIMLIKLIIVAIKYKSNYNE